MLLSIYEIKYFHPPQKEIEIKKNGIITHLVSGGLFFIMRCVRIAGDANAVPAQILSPPRGTSLLIRQLRWQHVSVGAA